MKQNISWKKKPIEIVVNDGTSLKGIVEYWAKDYKVYLKEPFCAEFSGSHLMYMIPAQYVTSEAEYKDGIKNIDIFPSSKERLLSLYNEKKCK